MMYRCCDCGNLFEEGEQAVWYETHGLDSPPYEKWDGCPVCRGDYEEVYQCKKCGDWHSEDELYDGWCEKCLRESINYDTFFEYCEDNREENLLDCFVMVCLLRCQYEDVPKKPSTEFHDLMVSTYKRAVADAKLLGGKFGFIEECISFTMDDSVERENYADWLNKREVKNNA